MTYRLRERHFDDYARSHEERFEERQGALRAVVSRSVTQYLDCGRLAEHPDLGGALARERPLLGRIADGTAAPRGSCRSAPWRRAREPHP